MHFMTAEDALRSTQAMHCETSATQRRLPVFANLTSYSTHCVRVSSALPPGSAVRRHRSPQCAGCRSSSAFAASAGCGARCDGRRPSPAPRSTRIAGLQVGVPLFRSDPPGSSHSDEHLNTHSGCAQNRHRELGSLPQGRAQRTNRSFSSEVVALTSTARHGELTGRRLLAASAADPAGRLPTAGFSAESPRGGAPRPAPLPAARSSRPPAATPASTATRP
jgi:hypothetical protein